MVGQWSGVGQNNFPGNKKSRQLIIQQSASEFIFSHVSDIRDQQYGYGSYEE